MNLIEEVERRLPPNRKLFLKLRCEHRYCTGSNGWTASVQEKYYSQVVEQLPKPGGKASIPSVADASH
ncbi:MAG: hypothetical protein HPY50_02185 [Firmicutes bacterium]|nr:hypothetical protein [Bacillota bacterium]